MISPRIDKILDHVDSKYAAVSISAKRARQINAYNRHLNDGSYEQHPPPMIEDPSRNNLSTALSEIATGKIKYEYR